MKFGATFNVRSFRCASQNSEDGGVDVSTARRDDDVHKDKTNCSVKGETDTQPERFGAV